MYVILTYQEISSSIQPPYFTDSLPQLVGVSWKPTSLLSRPQPTRFGEISSGYPTNVYDGNRLSLPILRHKMALSDV